MIRGWRAAPAKEPQPLLTRRLRLVAITPALLDAEEAGPKVLGTALGVAMPEDWPPEHWERSVRRFIRSQGHERPETLSWHRYMLLGPRWRRMVVGCVGAFPRVEGEVELGYSVVRSHQRQGIGSEGALALTEWLLRQGGVRSVSAQTYTTSVGSIRVMERCGMRYVGAGDEAGTVRYRRMREW